MNKVFWRQASFVLMFLASSSANGASGLPEKAFNVDGGSVSVVAGVMPNPTTAGGLPIGKLKYPTRYFIEFRNESPYPLWLDADWTFPQSGKDQPAKAQTVRGEKMPPGGSYWFHWDKLGVVVGNAIVVEIRAYSEEKRSNLVGRQTAQLYFDQPSVDRFYANFPNPFRNQTNEQKQAAVISGWYDIPPPRTDMPGTKADARLQRDIQLSIWKADSVKRWACEREVVSAASVDVDDSQLISRMPDETRQKARLEQADNTLSAERWMVRSCGQDLVYEVLLSASPQGGTDVMVLDTTHLSAAPDEEPAAIGE